MAIMLRAKFDGKVFVPQEPVNLSVGQEVEIQVVGSASCSPASSFVNLVQKWSSEPAGDDLPKDLAANVDHYLYGTPKRED